MISFEGYSFTAADRFLKYVQFDTQSDPASVSVPSTAKQLVLARELCLELEEAGATGVVLDDHGYVYATVASTIEGTVPVICFCSHMDTSPDCSGAGVIPIVHRNYQGQDLVLPHDPAVVIRQSEHPDLAAQLGNDLITASGRTLLGADNKAGLAEIVDAVHFLCSHPEVKHGEIRIVFTPDEEIGRGVDHIDLTRVNAEFAYTVDGETLGSLEDETFSADGAVLTISGISTHPGFAKGKMQSALKAAAEVVAGLPKDRLTPEATSGDEGFIHPVSISGSVEEARVEFILRDFDDTKLGDHAAMLNVMTNNVMSGYPDCTYSLRITPQYRNMKKILDQHPLVVAHAVTAMKRAGVVPKKQRIRGGTDGSRLSFMGLPCPNIFAGEHAFHSKQEWVSIHDMNCAVKVIVELAAVWGELEA